MAKRIRFTEAQMKDLREVSRKLLLLGDVTLAGRKGAIEVPCVIDCGCTFSAFSRRLLRQVGAASSRRKIRFGGLGSGEAIGDARIYTPVVALRGGPAIGIEAGEIDTAASLLLSALGVEAMIGMDYLVPAGAVIDCAVRRCTFDAAVLPRSLRGVDEMQSAAVRAELANLAKGFGKLCESFKGLLVAADEQGPEKDALHDPAP